MRDVPNEKGPAVPPAAPDQQVELFKSEVSARFGILPNFICLAESAPGL